MLRNLIRILGLTGLLLAGGGAMVLAAQGSDWNIAAHLSGESDQLANDSAHVLQISSIVLVTGAAFAGLAFLVEMLSSVRNSAGRRSALGMNAFVQIALAVVLVVGVNLWSTSHWHKRWDCTRDGVFTLDSDLKSQLGQIRDETTVIVYLTHNRAGRFSDQPPDQYDKAAEAKVVEKVQDLVDQLRQLGPRFRVVVLDHEQMDFDRRLAAEVQHFPNLAQAVRTAPENSIFFCTGDQLQTPRPAEHIQRLGFNEFYQLDKTGSKESNSGRGNLTLLYQGIQPFARRVLGIEARRPRVAVAVSHPWLSTEGPIDEYTLAGLRKSLTNDGFDVQDLVLKKLVGRRGRGMRLESSAMTLEESKFDQLEAQIRPLRNQIQQYERIKALLDLLESNKSDLDVAKDLVQFSDIISAGQVDKRAREAIAEKLKSILGPIDEREIDKKRAKLKQRQQELEELQTKERVVEGQRMTDLKQKMSMLLAECDMLIIARMTLRDVGVGDTVPNGIHTLEESQIAAIKEFLKAGKPVLFCLGPVNEPPDAGVPPSNDNLEALLADVGFVFAPQTVLYDSETDAIAASQVISFGRVAPADIPPVEFPATASKPPSSQDETRGIRPNPLAESMRLMKRSVDEPLDVRMRHPRPIYFHRVSGAGPFESAFILTSPQSWNEDQPFPTEDTPVPQFERPKPKDASKLPDDPTKGSRLERRHGPFPIGVAVEAKIPASFFDEKSESNNPVRKLVIAGLSTDEKTRVLGVLRGLACTGLDSPVEFGRQTIEALLANGESKSRPSSRTVRLAAIGHGGWFAGPKLSAADEMLLLNTADWLVARDDRLPRAEQVWEYPRVQLSEPHRVLWHLGTLFGLPGLFAWMGLVVLLIRRIR